MTTHPRIDDIRNAGAKCTGCGSTIESATPVNATGEVTPGSILVCFYCTTVNECVTVDPFTITRTTDPDVLADPVVKSTQAAFLRSKRRMN